MCERESEREREKEREDLVKGRYKTRDYVE